MTRGVTIRLVLIGTAIATGLLVIAITLGSADDALRAVAPAIERNQREVILDSVHSTQFVRGLIGIVVAALLAAWIGGAVTRMLRSARTADRLSSAATRGFWLREAQDVATSRANSTADAAERFGALDRKAGDLHRLLESVSEGILQLDAAGRVVRANRAARRQLGLPDDVEGRLIGTVVRNAELRGLLQRATVEDALPPREITLDDATLVVTARRLGDLRAAGGSGLAVAIADLTGLRRLEKVRRDFVANASHELKTPLTSIRGYAETLRDEALPTDMRQQFLQTISRNAERLQHIVDDLLDLSRFESGAWQPALAPVDAAAVARETWVDFEARAQEAAVRFHVDDRLRSAVRADAIALRHVFANLFDNALRYTTRGGEIRVRLSESEAHDPDARDRRIRFAAIEVSDDGAGIPSDALPRIFERFYRVDPARSRADGGTGLGLAIVRHMVESMDGRVEAESLLGQGTTIRVLLPLAGSAPDARST